MGVAGLWDILKPAAKTRSLTELAVTEGFRANPKGLRGYRIGIDASIWFFHAEYGKEGENPVLRTLFFRCATLMKLPFLPLFVFDGPKRPDFKRGKRINKAGNKLIPGMKRIVEAFGFEWRTAPGEAEAELAYLNRIGVIDGILSDDVDNFLFGALTVIRNPSNNLSGNKSNPVLNSEGKDDKNHTRVFRFQDIHDHSEIQLTRGGLILIGLMSGGDYEGGLERCGIATAHAIARCGFGDSLITAARTLSREGLDEFLDNWRQELRQELKTNSRGFMTRKALSLAKSIPDTFPNIDVLLSYVNPVTSESLGHEGANPKITWSKEPNVAALASACELFFEWGYEEAIVKRFRTVIWPGTVLRILRRAVLDVDAHSAPTSTPHKLKPNDIDSEDGYGTPSKMIAKHFSAIKLNDDEADSGQGEESPLIVSISRERRHPSTDGLPEYRLEIAPAQLVNMAISGLQGLRQPEGPNEWASDEDDLDDEDDEGGGRGKKGKAKEPVDPMSQLRVWMPECMVDPVEKRLVRNFRDKKNKKRAPARKKKQTQDGSVRTSPVRRKRAPAKKKQETEEELSDFPSSDKTQPKATTSSTRTSSPPVSRTSDVERLLPQTPSKQTPQPFPLGFAARREEEEESSEDEGELPTIPIPAPIPKARATVIAQPKKPSNRPVASSKTSQVAATFETSTTTTVSSIPSSRVIEDTLALSESDEELPMDLYKSVRPKKPLQPTTSHNIPGYLSLSDDDDVRKATSPVKLKKPTNKKPTTQATLSAFVGRSHRKVPSITQDDRPTTPPLLKSPRKSKSHSSPRSKGQAASKATKEGSSIIVISDESDDGYSGVSRPVLAPLQLARNRARENRLASARSKPSTVSASIVIDLT